MIITLACIRCTDRMIRSLVKDGKTGQYALEAGQVNTVIGEVIHVRAAFTVTGGEALCSVCVSEQRIQEATQERDVSDARAGR